MKTRTARSCCCSSGAVTRWNPRWTWPRRLALANEKSFDVLVSDVTLPDGSGIDLLAQMKSRPPQYGGIIISGYGMDDDIARSKAAGYRAHLTKPVAVQQLDETIQRMVREAV